MAKAFKLPTFDSIQVGPIEWRVERVEALVDEEDAPLHGQCDHGKFTIRLNDDLRGAALTVTLWHEVLHGLDGIYGLELSEAQVTLLAPMIVQLLRDNEELRG